MPANGAKPTDNSNNNGCFTKACKMASSPGRPEKQAGRHTPPVSEISSRTRMLHLPVHVRPVDELKIVKTDNGSESEKEKGKLDKVNGNALLYSHPTSSTHQMKTAQGVGNVEAKWSRSGTADQPTATTATLCGELELFAVGRDVRGSDQGVCQKSTTLDPSKIIDRLRIQS
ncbi:hypothetical protein T08_8449 [Trichinella sp. T8]|nr:hypothetical protein T08_8449 [Trichinella sp. T8]